MDSVSQIVKAFSTVIAMLVHELEQNGSLGEIDIAAQLNEMANDAEQPSPEGQINQNQMAIHIVRHVAHAIERQRQQADNSDTPEGWNPIVIEGGVKARDQEGD
jgi:hypothetical protein